MRRYTPSLTTSLFGCLLENRRKAEQAQAQADSSSGAFPFAVSTIQAHVCVEFGYRVCGCRQSSQNARSVRMERCKNDHYVTVGQGLCDVHITMGYGCVVVYNVRLFISLPFFSFSLLLFLTLCLDPSAGTACWTCPARQSRSVY